jgi:hypothetical protein
MYQQYARNTVKYIRFDNRDSIGDYGMKSDTYKQSKGANYEKNSGVIGGVRVVVFIIEFRNPRGLAGRVFIPNGG